MLSQERSSQSTKYSIVQQNKADKEDEYAG